MELNSFDKIYVINLDQSTDRLKCFDDTHTRWRATPRNEVDEITDKKMISYSSSPRDYHLSKCGCLLSHLNLLKHIVKNKLNNIIILEDDAEKISEVVINKLPTDGLTYLGGFFHNIKMTSKEKIINNSSDGINKLDKNKMRMLMCLSYYIPKWEIADIIVNHLEKLNRYRAIDILLFNIDIPTYYNYPANYIEKDIISTIRNKKTKHSTKYYQWK
tara:strand:- start:534 stop:1181 length:648 start_codon:yes stop_codon:yes gene_type:complete